MSKANFVSKFPNVGTTIFTEMSLLAQEHNAINLSQGFPDYPVDPLLIEYLKEAVDTASHQYTHMAGLPSLRKAVQEMVFELDGIVYDFESEITITAGASEALFNAVAAIIHAGDEVIIFEPAYDLYTPVLQMFGAKVVPVVLNKPNFEIDWEEVSSKVSANTKCIIINHPNNPTGKVLTSADIDMLAQIADDNNLYVIADEVYARIVFEPHKFVSVATHPLLRNRTIVVASFGKLLHATGWKVGYCLAPPLLSREIRKVHQYNTFCVQPMAQYAIAKYLHSAKHLLSLGDFFIAKKNLLSEGLSAIGFEVLPSEGTYFLNAGYSSFSDMDDRAYSKWLTANIGVATIPVSAFYSNTQHQKILRFCFAKMDQTLINALDKLKLLS